LLLLACGTSKARWWRLTDVASRVRRVAGRAARLAIPLLKAVLKSNINTMARGSLVPVVVCALALAALAPVRTAHAEQFWTTQALLADQFKSSLNVSYVRARLDPAVRARLEARLGRALPKTEYTLFIAKSGERVDGYALFDEQVGQHEPISFATFFDAAGAVTRVEVVAYREPYGEGIRSERFRKQFVGRNAKSKYRAGDDVDTISGATISSRSTCIAVERAVVLVEAWLQKQAQPLAAADRGHVLATTSSGAPVNAQ
jgi:electron transport complex protein RnfG